MHPTMTSLPSIGRAPGGSPNYPLLKLSLGCAQVSVNKTRVEPWEKVACTWRVDIKFCGTEDFLALYRADKATRWDEYEASLMSRWQSVEAGQLTFVAPRDFGMYIIALVHDVGGYDDEAQVLATAMFQVCDGNS